MSHTARFQDTLRRLVIFDEGFVDAGFGLGRAGASALDAKTAALLQVAVSVAIGSSPVCLQWGAAQAKPSIDEPFVEDHQPAQGFLESCRLTHTPPMSPTISTPHGRDTVIPRWG